MSEFSARLDLRQETFQNQVKKTFTNLYPEPKLISAVTDANTSKEYAWTIMLYMYPLDKVFEQPFEILSNKLSKLGINNNVAFVGQLYHSQDVKYLGQWKTANRFLVNASGLQYQDAAFYRSDLDISSNTTLADFIEWCKQTAPAKNYLLVIWDHGGCFYLFESYNYTDFSPDVEFKMKSVNKNLFIEKLYKSRRDTNKKFGHWFLVESSDDLETARELNHCRGFIRRFDVPDENYSDEPKLLITDKKVGKYQFAIVAPEKLANEYLYDVIREPVDALRYSLQNKNSTGSLSVQEIKNALSSSFPYKKLNNILFLACCMQTLETAYELKDHCDFLTASEDLMDFKALQNINTFEGLVENHTLNPKDLAIKFVSDFPDYVSGLVRSLGTLSSIDTAKINDLVLMIDELAEYLITNKSILKNDVKAARNKCRYFSWFTKFYNIDFIWFLKNLKFITSDEALKAQIDKIIEYAIDNKLVLDSFAGDARTGDFTKPSYGAHGFTIFFPKNIIEFNNSGLCDYYTPGMKETLSYVKGDRKWAEFLREYGCIP